MILGFPYDFELCEYSVRFGAMQDIDVDTHSYALT